jgi:hypothetical protein
MYEENDGIKGLLPTMSDLMFAMSKKVTVNASTMSELVYEEFCERIDDTGVVVILVHDCMEYFQSVQSVNVAVIPRRRETRDDRRIHVHKSLHERSCFEGKGWKRNTCRFEIHDIDDVSLIFEVGLAV